MLDIFTKFAQGGKDILISQLAKFLLNNFGLEAYGQMVRLDIDTQAKQLSFVFLLKGEDQPVTGTIAYHVEATGNDLVLVADSATMSREWINVVFDRHIGPEKRRIIIPPHLHPVIKIAGV